MTLLSWIQLVLLIAAAGAVAGAIVGGLGARRCLQTLETIAPQPRFLFLSAFALLPAAMAVLAVAVAFAPSMLDLVGLLDDHCTSHDGHFHLCFVHGHPPLLSFPIVLALGAFALWLLAGWRRCFSSALSARRWSAKLLRTASYDEALGGWTVRSSRPFALAIGVLFPRLCVSDGMRNLLTKRQFEAVIAHERAHANRHDSLVKLVARACAQLHLAAVKHRILDELDVACEQSCDEVAARAVADRIVVAEALLTVERAMGRTAIPAAALAFGAQSLERRVHAMLSDDWRQPSGAAVVGAILVATAALLASYDRPHHAAETILDWLV